MGHKKGGGERRKMVRECEQDKTRYRKHTLKKKVGGARGAKKKRNSTKEKARLTKEKVNKEGKILNAKLWTRKK